MGRVPELREATAGLPTTTLVGQGGFQQLSRRDADRDRVSSGPGAPETVDRMSLEKVQLQAPRGHCYPPNTHFQGGQGAGQGLLCGDGTGSWPVAGLPNQIPRQVCTPSVDGTLSPGVDSTLSWVLPFQ